MKYHYFTKDFPSSHKWISTGEQCVFCKKYMIDIYNLLSYELKIISNKLLINNPNRRILEEEFYAINVPCEFGLTKDEYIIKGIIE